MVLDLDASNSDAKTLLKKLKQNITKPNVIISCIDPSSSSPKSDCVYVNGEKKLQTINPYGSLTLPVGRWTIEIQAGFTRSKPVEITINSNKDEYEVKYRVKFFKTTVEVNKIKQRRITFLQTVGNDYIDTLQFARKVLKGVGSYSLGNLAEYYGISSVGAHRALNDCRMNQQVFEHLAKEMGSLPQFCGGVVSGTAPGVVTGTLRCPKCGSSLIKRSGKFGEFWGCLNFPDCKFTKDAK